MLILGLIILFLLIFIAVMNFAVLLDISFVGHDFTTQPQAVTVVAKIIKSKNIIKLKVVDLGSCRGDFLVRLGIKCPNILGIGVDNSKFRVFLSNLKSLLTGSRIKFVVGDLYKTDITDADVVYLYHSQDSMIGLESKLRAEMKPGAMAIINTQHFPNWALAETYITHPKNPEFEKMFVYVK